MRLVDADDLKDWSENIQLTDDGGIDINDFEEKLASMPTIDAELVRHGAWLPCDKNGYILTETELRDGRRWYGYECSECNNIYHGNALTKYCPNCGAKMDGKGK